MMLLNTNHSPLSKFQQTDEKCWLERLEMLVARFGYMQIEADIASLTLIELWALYMRLSRLAAE